MPSAVHGRSVLHWVSACALRRWPHLAAVAGILLIRTGVELLRPWPLKVLIDGVLAPQPGTRAIPVHWWSWLSQPTREVMVLYCALGTLLVLASARGAAA